MSNNVSFSCTNSLVTIMVVINHRNIPRGPRCLHTPWFKSSAVRAWRTGLLGLVCDHLASTHLFGTLGGTRNIKMSTEGKAEVSERNQILIDKDKLKEEQKAEVKAAIEAYEQRCLLSYSTNWSGEIIKKYNFPTLPAYNESQ